MLLGIANGSLPRLPPIEETEQPRRRVISNVRARLFRPGSRQPGLPCLRFLTRCFGLPHSFCCFGCWRCFYWRRHLCCLNDYRGRRGTKRFASHSRRLGAYAFGSGCGRLKIFAPPVECECQQETDKNEVFEERHGEQIASKRINGSYPCRRSPSPTVSLETASKGPGRYGRGFLIVRKYSCSSLMGSRVVGSKAFPAA